MCKLDFIKSNNVFCGKTIEKTRPRLGEYIDDISIRELLLKIYEEFSKLGNKMTNQKNRKFLKKIDGWQLTQEKTPNIMSLGR